MTRAIAVDSASLGLIRWLAGDWAALSRCANERSSATPTSAPVATSPTAAADDDQEPIRQLEEFLKGDIGRSAIAQGICKLGSAISKPTLAAIDKEIHSSIRPIARKQLADHFWCDLFTAFAQAIECLQSALEEALEKVPDLVVKAILSSPLHQNRDLITRTLVKAAVRQAWKPIKRAVATAFDQTLNCDQILLWLRVLAVLTCPAPGRHREMVEHCLIPLGKPVLEEEIKDRLRAVLPPELTEGLGERPNSEQS